MHMHKYQLVFIQGCKHDFIFENQCKLSINGDSDNIYIIISIGTLNIWYKEYLKILTHIYAKVYIPKYEISC